MLIIHYIIYMSYLQRTGNGRNNISWTNTSNNTIKYLHRTGTSRNSIKWSTISTSANILQRTGTSRNNIKWSTLTVMTEEGILGQNLYNDILPYNGHIGYPFASYKTYGSEGTIKNYSTYFQITPVKASYPDTDISLKLRPSNIYPKNSGESNLDYIDRLNSIIRGFKTKYNGKNIFTKIEAVESRGSSTTVTKTNCTCSVTTSNAYGDSTGVDGYGSISIYFKDSNSSNIELSGYNKYYYIS